MDKVGVICDTPWEGATTACSVQPALQLAASDSVMRFKQKKLSIRLL